MSSRYTCFQCRTIVEPGERHNGNDCATVRAAHEAIGHWAAIAAHPVAGDAEYWRLRADCVRQLERRPVAAEGRIPFPGHRTVAEIDREARR